MPGLLSVVRQIYSRDHPVFARDHSGVRQAMSRVASVQGCDNRVAGGTSETVLQGSSQPSRVAESYEAELADAAAAWPSSQRPLSGHRARAQPLTFFAPVRPGHVLWTRLTLPLLRLFAPSSAHTRLRYLHFGSWTLLRGGTRQWYLLIQAEIDIWLDELTANLLAESYTVLRLAFGSSKEFPRPATTRLLSEYLRQHRVTELVHYVAYPDATVRDIDAALAVAARIEELAQVRTDDEQQFTSRYRALLGSLAHAPEPKPAWPLIDAWRVLRTKDTVTGITLLLPLTQHQTDRAIDAIHAIADEPSLFDQVGGVHLARMATVATAGHDHLLISAWYDGPVITFVQHLVDACGQRLDSILRNCKGYPGAVDTATLTEWIARHHYPASLFLPSISGVTAEEVKAALRLKERALLVVTRQQDRSVAEIQRELKALP